MPIKAGLLAWSLAVAVTATLVIARCYKPNKDQSVTSKPAAASSPRRSRSPKPRTTDEQSQVPPAAPETKADEQPMVEHPDPIQTPRTKKSEDQIIADSKLLADELEKEISGQAGGDAESKADRSSSSAPGVDAVKSTESPAANFSIGPATIDPGSVGPVTEDAETIARRGKLTQLFRMFDLNDNGTIELREVLELSKARRDLLELNVNIDLGADNVWLKGEENRLVHLCAEGQDGKIEMNEFVQFFLSELQALGPNEFNDVIREFNMVFRSLNDDEELDDEDYNSSPPTPSSSSLLDNR